MPFVCVSLKASFKASKFTAGETQTQQNILLGKQEFCFLYRSIKLNNLISYKMSTICFSHVKQSVGILQSTPEQQQFVAAVAHISIWEVFNGFNCFLAKWHKPLIIAF